MLNNIVNYLEWRGDITFAERAFNEVDALISAMLSYVDFSGIVPENGEEIPLYKAAEQYLNSPHKNTENTAGINRMFEYLDVVANELLPPLAASQRFKDIILLTIGLLFISIPSWILQALGTFMYQCLTIFTVVKIIFYIRELKENPRLKKRNLGYYFHHIGDLNSAKKYLEQGIAYLEKYGNLNHDFIAFAHNYANLISDCGEPLKAIRALKKCADMVKSGMSDLCAEYVDLYFDIGVIYLQVGDKSKSEQSLGEAFRVYRIIFADDAEVLSEKKNQLLGFTSQAVLSE